MSFGFGFALPAYQVLLGAGWVPYPPPSRFLLIENGSFLLQENGHKIGLE